ncbi:MAG: HD-GYP domain-containing protein [Oscillospiraceae bacterium]|nr:HD-GYP domain-containing protein [Oscillospiraceae bacterium]
MVFVRTEELLSGMCLARDIHFYDMSLGSAVIMKKDQKLTDMQITQLLNAKLDGAYVDTATSEVRIVSSINQEIRREAISNIHSLADNFIDSNKGVQKSDIEAIGSTAQDLIDSLSSKKDILINIADIKMYDDYTYHHSLSVSIMAIAIGIELGLTNQMLKELGLAGLLHDIGKVAIPIEIINKPGKLTPEEFDIVKMHPVHAATHLRERNLVNDNIFAGIVGHHEKLDCSGYPQKLSGTDIHPYARILMVADVYDALTSNRPYRTPSPPNEAIEYVMGGMGTHFDERVVHAFLRKVAPYPTGSKVKLSNGETAYVMKNYPDQPLRPMVAVIGSEKTYDLSWDLNCLNIVITELMEEKKFNRTLINM